MCQQTTLVTDNTSLTRTVVVDRPTARKVSGRTVVLV